MAELILVRPSAGFRVFEGDKASPSYSSDWVTNRQQQLQQLLNQLEVYRRRVTAAEPPAPPEILPALGELILDRRAYDVKAIEEDKAATVVPDETIYLDVSHPEASDAVMWHLEEIHAECAAEDGRGVVIGVVDTGISRDHHEFRDRAAGLHRFLNAANERPNEEEIPDPDGHGTRVCSLVVGRVAGLARMATLVVAGLENTDRHTTRVRIARAFDWIGKTDFGRASGLWGCDVLNVSLGFSPPGGDRYHALYEAFKELGQGLEIVIVAAAGNSGPGKDSGRSPGNYDAVISVGASISGGVLAETSSWGDSHEKDKYPNVSAPGIGIVFTDERGNRFVDSGTSYASPLVAATAALLVQKEIEAQTKVTQVRARVIEKLLTLVRKPAGIFNAPGATPAEIASRGGAGILDLSKL